MTLLNLKYELSKHSKTMKYDININILIKLNLNIRYNENEEDGKEEEEEDVNKRYFDRLILND